MLFAVFPVAFVDAAVWPGISSIPVFLIVNILTIVLFLIFPDVLAESMHVAILPLPLVHSSVFPLVDTKAIDHIVEPLASVLGPIFPNVNATTFLFVVFIFSEVF